MVAIVSGGGLGLFDTSFARLGRVEGGDPGLGQGRLDDYINIATGNLVLRQQDDVFVSHDWARSFVRTYNSRGDYLFSGADGWFGRFESALVFHHGGSDKSHGNGKGHGNGKAHGRGNGSSPNSHGHGATSGPGLSLTRIGADGSETLYTLDPGDPSETRYIATDGAGAHDTLKFNETTQRWIWTEGTSRRQAQYDIHGRLLELVDTRSGASFKVHYEAIDKKHERIASIENDAGEAVVFAYNAAGQLASLTLQTGGQSTQQVSYAYDSLGRLTTVSVDLKPGVVDSGVYTTEYGYDGGSLRIAEVTQSDGTRLGLTYVQVDGAWRVKTATTGAGATAETLRFAWHTDRHQTDVTDALGRTWSYVYNGAGQLSEVLSPPVDGRRLVTAYRYDADGNLTAVTDARGDTVTYTYDTHGNQLSQVDALGNTIERTWTADNQLATETAFTKSSPNGGAETARYVYDAANRLRYVVSAAGEVIQNTYGESGTAEGLLIRRRTFLTARYDVAGLAPDEALTERVLDAWAAAQDATDTSRIDYTYDFRGQLASETAYAHVGPDGAGLLDAAARVTHYVYDAHGLLRQSIVLRGAERQAAETTGYAYDGLGRLIATTDAEGHTTTRLYDGAHRRITVTNAAGLATTTVHDAAGRTIAVVAGGAGDTPRHETYYNYDAAGQLRAVVDAAGAISYRFYDAAGRLAGEVDATGAVTEYAYNADGQRIRTTRYATRVDTRAWLKGGAALPASLDAVRPEASADDRLTSRAYDAAGRLATETDASGLVTRYVYDGAGHLLKTKRGDRIIRYFYDADGRQTGVLDAGGYLTETIRDAAGRIVKTIAYAQRSSKKSAKTLAALRPVIDAAHDQVTRYFYDGLGQRVGELDAEGYLTEWVYDEAGHERLKTRYATRLTALDGTETLPALRARVANGARHDTRTSYDELGRISVVVDPENTVTRYEYDAVGRLIHTRADDNVSAVRDDYRRYDVFGNLIGELKGEGAAHYQAGMSEAALDALYAEHGTRYRYDAVGRRTQSIDANGNKSWFIYDADGRLTHTVRGIADEDGIQNAMGEVSETVYNAFGQASETLRYAGRIDTADLGNLAAAIHAILNPARDSQSVYHYDTRGLLLSRATARTATETDTIRYAYNAYGERTDTTVEIDADRSVITHADYNARGLVIDLTRDYGGLNLHVHRDYDAFGRVTSLTDARGHTTTFAFDRLGRQIASTQTVAGQPATRTTAYDAFSRTLSQTDALGHVTRYAYDESARSVTVTSPEGVEVTTWRDGYGDIVRLRDGAGHITTQTYDRDGRLVDTALADADGQPIELLKQNGYDAVGNRIFSIDANGRQTEYAWDAASRLLTRTNGAGETTCYGYDGKGQRIRVTDPRGVVTETCFDRKGEVIRVIADAGEGGLQLATTYTYDRRGRRLTVTEGGGTADARTAQYVYDKLGRRIATIVDPQGLKLTTQYAYDANDNLIRRTEGPNSDETRVTRYAYDEANQRVFEVGSDGAVNRTFYDKTGRVTAITRYAHRISTEDLNDASDAAAIADKLRHDAEHDQTTWRVADGDGRLRYAIDATGAVTSYSYDGNGDVLEAVHYARPVNLSAARRAALGGGASAERVADWIATSAADRHTATVYDALGRARFVLRQQGNQATVTETRYDGVGNVVARIAYGDNVGYAAGLDVDALSRALADEPSRETRYTYDGANRLRFTIDALNHVVEARYDAAGNVTARLVYAESLNPEDDLKAWAQSHDDDAATRCTGYAYDAAGRLKTVTDALGHTQKYTYTATSLKQSWTNQNGDTWEYSYDKAGRLTETRSPLIHTVYWESGELEHLNAAIVTRISYDAFGNVISRTEAAGGPEERTTRYSYDAAGRQVATTRADGVSTEVLYDAFGNAVASRDERGHYRYKVYGDDNRLRFDIDAMGYVTAYRYDAFGDQTSVTRYADCIDLGDRQLAPLDATTVEGLLHPDADHDRTLTTRFDELGRKAAIVEEYLTDNYDPAGNGRVYGGRPETRYAYNAYGELATESVRIDQNTWAATHHYYDALGRKRMDVDAQGYVTEWAYTVTGEVKRATEYARAIDPDALSATAAPDAPDAGDATTGYDRITVHTYDKLGREASISQSRHYQDHDGNTLIGSLTTTKRYDAVGNVICINRNGQVSTTDYNALGHIIRTTAPERAVLATDDAARLAGGLANTGIMNIIAPETKYAVNAFGQALETTRDSGSRITEDRITYNHYDVLGRLIEHQDAEGYISHRRYDDAGHLIEERHDQRDANGYGWEVKTENRYDANGHLIRTTLTRHFGNLETHTESDTALSYNAFGELIGRGSAGADAPAVYSTYDSAGRLRSTNSGDGVKKRYEYNLAGVKTHQSVGDDASYVTTIYHLDSNGRATRIELPPLIRNHTKPHLELRLDRWGNALAQTDARGFTTHYTYNEAGQRTSAITPMTKSVDEQGEVHWLRPVSHFFYDVFGRRIGARDANGHISRRYFDGAGNVVRAENALGDATIHAYDAFGDELAAQNPTGYVTTKRYDNNGRVIETGDVHIEDNAWVAGR
ncbi:MAG TPA: hypothetical protein VFK45_07300, partial [Gammaproteobacteria bacterium]|nr:hypothetical protein [Gammaproteobacteria bacterium]